MEQNLIELIRLANTSNDSSTLEKLASNVNTLVRRAVARNHATPFKIVNSLTDDPVLNVSYMASKNPNSSTTRVFENIDHPCVVCQVEEQHMNCTGCDTLKNYN